MQLRWWGLQSASFALQRPILPRVGGITYLQSETTKLRYDWAATNVYGVEFVHEDRYR